MAEAVLVALDEPLATEPRTHSKRGRAAHRAGLKRQRLIIVEEIVQFERQKRDLSHRLRSWPTEDDRLLPTRLGNVIRHFEDKANGILGGSNDERLCGAEELGEVLPLVHSRLLEGMAAQHDFFRAQLQTATALMMVIPIVGVMLSPTSWPASSHRGSTIPSTSHGLVSDHPERQD